MRCVVKSVGDYTPKLIDVSVFTLDNNIIKIYLAFNKFLPESIKVVLKGFDSFEFIVSDWPGIVSAVLTSNNSLEFHGYDWSYRNCGKSLCVTLIPFGDVKCLSHEVITIEEAKF